MFYPVEWQSMNSDRLQGGYLGLALGDALGMVGLPGPLRTPPAIRRRYQATRYGVIGEIGDETQMTTALLWSLRTNPNCFRPGYTASQARVPLLSMVTTLNRSQVDDSVITEYIGFANQSSHIGRNTRELLHGIRTVQGYWTRRQRIDLTNRQSNGSLMRAYGLVLAPNTYAVGCVDTQLTNPSPINLDATLVYLQLLDSMLLGESLDRGLSRLFIQTEPVLEAINQARRREVRMLTGPDRGWVPHPLYVAVRALEQVQHEPIHRIYDWIISLGGDVEANAAVAGSLMGVVLGRSGLERDPVTAGNLTTILQAASETPRYSPMAGLSLLPSLS